MRERTKWTLTAEQAESARRAGTDNICRIVFDLAPKAPWSAAACCCFYASFALN
jgi:hypothetical protein